MIKTILKYCSLVILFGSLAFGIVWAATEGEKAKCTGVEIVILNSGENLFLSRQVVEDDIMGIGTPIKGSDLQKIDLDKIEKALGKLDYIEWVQCYRKFDIVDCGKKMPDSDLGHIVVEVKQLEPVMRIIESNGLSHYVNKDGKRMKASERFRYNVPVVYGHFTESFPEKSIVPLISYISANDAIRQYVSALKVVDANNILIIPSIKGHVVNFGNIYNIDGKFAKLRKFYKDVIPVKGWAEYDTISVKWDYQVVATRRDKRKPYEESFGPEDDEIAPDADMLNSLAIAAGDTSVIASIRKNK